MMEVSTVINDRLPFVKASDGGEIVGKGLDHNFYSPATCSIEVEVCYGKWREVRW
jgi:hypothetical protein